MSYQNFSLNNRSLSSSSLHRSKKIYFNSTINSKETHKVIINCLILTNLVDHYNNKITILIIIIIIFQVRKSKITVHRINLKIKIIIEATLNKDTNFQIIKFNNFNNSNHRRNHKCSLDFKVEVSLKMFNYSKKI